MTVWLALVGMAAVTYLLRASFFLLPPQVETPALLRRALRFVPAAVLTAVWLPELFFQKGTLYLAAGNEKLLAGCVAVAIAWRWRSTFATIVAGMSALHLFGLLKLG